MNPKAMPDLSILVIVRSNMYLDKLLPSIAAQTLTAGVEAIFYDKQVSQSASNALQEFKDSHDFVDVIDGNDRVNVPQARNILADAANAPVVAYTDDDVELPHGWAQRILKHFENGVDAVGGRMVSDQTAFAAVFEDRRRRVWYDYVAENDVAHLETANFAVKRSLLEKLGFDEQAQFAEDLELTQRLVQAEYDIRFDTSLIVYHHHRTNMLGLLRQHYWYGYGYAYVDRKFGLMSRKKYLKMLWYLLSPLTVLTRSIPLVAIALFSYQINKYSLPLLKNAVGCQNLISASVIVMEPARFLCFSIGYAVRLILLRLEDH